MTPRSDSLTGERVRLSPVARQDIADHIRWRNDPDVAYWATAGDPNFSPVTAVAVERHFEETLLVLDPLKAGVLGVHTLVDDRRIGMVDYREIDPVVRSATVGITIGEKELWGQRYGSEALGLLVAHLFAHLNLRRIQLDTWSGNERAVRSFTRLGFREEGRLREAVHGPDGYFDSVIMGLLRAEWHHP